VILVRQLRFIVLWMPILTFCGVLAIHALYIRHLTSIPTNGWADVGVGCVDWWGFASYITEMDYLMGLSYALGAAFGAWALGQYLRTRQAAMAAGAAGSITLVGIFMATGCFFVGCCGSPMFGVYLGLFGAKALGIGKPLMAIFTLLSVAWGSWYLRCKLATACCDMSCGCHSEADNKAK